MFGIGFGSAILYHARTANVTATVLREPEGKYAFIDPLIGFNPGGKEDFPEYGGLERTLRSAIGNLERSKKVHSASIYVRDMGTGHWTGVNEEELFSPASLYKVTLMIAVLKRSEHEPRLLDERLTFKGSLSEEKPDFPPLTKGQSYTVRELLLRLITLSDNDAKDMLRERIGAAAVSEVFRDLQLSEPGLAEVGDSMSARLYSRFFRTLYNATYLNREHSEYALKLLSETHFKSGIVNGLPEDARSLPVAHKFGYRVFPDAIDGVTKELHDCGIVYVPKRPYFVCIMTKGWNQTHLMDAIQALSRTTYDSVATR